MSANPHDRIKAECRETERLLRRAWRIGVPVPTDPRLWDSDDDMNIEAGVGLQELELVSQSWLTEEGKARLKFAIEDAETKREDAKIERRNKNLAFYAQIVAMIVSLGGVLMGLIALWKR